MSLLTVPAYGQNDRPDTAASERGDNAAALLEWRAFAAQGDGDAQASLGLLYARGEGVPQDYAEAVKWFRLSAATGSAIGQNNLGHMYRNGLGVPQNYATAVLYYRLSAAQGYALAQGSLGAMYQNGDGIRRDYVEAHTWYALAAEQGHEGARRARLLLEQQMSDEQKAAALARVRDHKKRKLMARLPKQPPPADSTPPALPDGASWKIQMASLRNPTDVVTEWKRLQNVNQDLLHGLKLHVQQAELTKGIFYRLQAGPLADRATAISLCNSLKSRNQDCLIVFP